MKVKLSGSMVVKMVIDLFIRVRLVDEPEAREIGANSVAMPVIKCLSSLSSSSFIPILIQTQKTMTMVGMMGISEK